MCEGAFADKVPCKKLEACAIASKNIHLSRSILTQMLVLNPSKIALTLVARQISQHVPRLVTSAITFVTPGRTRQGRAVAL